MHYLAQLGIHCLAFLLFFPLTALSLSDEYGELGPPQICRCYTVQPSCAPPSPSPSGDPPSPSPSLLPTLPPNARCSLSSPNSSPCPDTHPCSCSGYCRKRVSLNVTIITDDSGTLFTCNGSSIIQTDFFDQKMTTELLNVPCDNFLVHVRNEVDSSAVSLLLEFEDGTVYGSTNGSSPYTKSDVRPLNAFVTYGPYTNYNGWTLNDGSVEYTDWISSFIVETLLNEGVELQNMIQKGAWPVGVWSAEVSSSTDYGYFFEAPYCTDDDEARVFV